MSTRKSFAAFVVMSFVTYGALQGFCAVPCSELKARIEDGLKAKGVPAYTLTVIPMSEASDGKVVGTCDGNTQKIIYARGTASTEKEKPAKPADKKPEVAK